MTLPVIIEDVGAQPTPPEQLLNDLTQKVADIVPDYDVILPPALISDLAQTATMAVSQIDQMCVDLINSVSPYGANIPLIREYGYLYGITQTTGQNVQVYLNFEGTPGFLISKGFLVGTGNYQFSVQNTVTIPTNGRLNNVFALGVSTGDYPIPENTVTQIITSIPSNITLSCTNPQPGIPAQDPENIDDYKERVLQAGKRTVQGSPDFIKATLAQVPGVVHNLIAVRNPAPGRFAVVVAGGDNFQVASAIYLSVPDVSALTADVTNVSGEAITSVTINISSPPDTYPVIFIRPTVQQVGIALVYKTTVALAVGVDAVIALASEPIVDYINGLMIGEPINLLTIQSIFITSIVSIIAPEQIANVAITITIDGKPAAPAEGTSVVYGDLYAYFLTTLTDIKITAG